MIAPPNVSARHRDLLTTLGAAIVSGERPPGQVLTLDGVSAQYGVSRSVVREAIRVLESMNMVESRRRIGITVQPAVNWNVFDPKLIRWRLQAGDRSAQLLRLFELRRAIEPAAAALAARRADSDQCRVMAAAVSDMVMHARGGDIESYLLAHSTFHTVLLNASGNDMFRALTDVIAEVLAGPGGRSAAPAAPDPTVIELHDEVARAIRLSDQTAAERAMRTIVDKASTGLR